MCVCVYQHQSCSFTILVLLDAKFWMLRPRTVQRYQRVLLHTSMCPSRSQRSTLKAATMTLFSLACPLQSEAILRSIFTESSIANFRQIIWPTSKALPAVMNMAFFGRVGEAWKWSAKGFKVQKPTSFTKLRYLSERFVAKTTSLCSVALPSTFL